MSATPCEELCDEGQVACAKWETDPLKTELLDCVAILEAAGWASAAYDDVQLPNKKTLNTKCAAARTYYLHTGGGQKDRLWCLRCLAKLSRKELLARVAQQDQQEQEHEMRQ